MTLGVLRPSGGPRRAAAAHGDECRLPRPAAAHFDERVQGTAWSGLWHDTALRNRLADKNEEAKWLKSESVPVLLQMLMAEAAPVREVLVKQLAHVRGERSTAGPRPDRPVRPGREGARRGDPGPRHSAGQALPGLLCSRASSTPGPSSPTTPPRHRGAGERRTPSPPW